MYARTLKNGLFAMAAAGFLLIPLFGETASAADNMCSTCIPFNMNYTIGATNYTNTNIAAINTTDPSLVEQVFPSGAFHEYGVLGFNYYNVYNPGSGSGALGVGGTYNSTPHMPFAGTDIQTGGSTQLFILYDVTGTLSGLPGTINFAPGGTLTLYLGTYSQDANGIVSAGASTSIASFVLNGGTSPVTGTETGGLSLSAEQIFMQQVSGDNNLFTNLLGQALFDQLTNTAFATEFGQGSSTTNGFNPCKSAQLSQLGNLGAGAECTTTQTPGITIQLQRVPEPISLVLFGSGLISLAVVRRRWRRKQVAVS